MSSYSNNRHEVHLTGIPGRPGVRSVVVNGCETGREAVSVAENMYGGKATGSQAHWLPSSGGGGSSSSGGGFGALLGLGILLAPIVIIGSIVGGGEPEPSYTPSYSQAPVESTYNPPAPVTPSWDNGPCVTANFEPC